MFASRSVLLLSLAVALVVSGCGDRDDDITLIGPGLEPGAGRIYPLRDVAFGTVDGVAVSGVLGTASGSRAAPVVVLLHDLDAHKQAWLTESALFVELLERGYAVLAIDLRGFGSTPLPGGREVLLLDDLEASYLDVQAALDWLAGRPEVDASRVALIGSGSGGNVAYVSAGALSGRIRTTISLSPGLWESNTLQPVVIGAGLDPFAPASMLFVVAEEDVLPVGDQAGTVLSYADFAAVLAASTAEPKSVLVVPGSAAHGLELLSGGPTVVNAVLAWLEQYL